MDDVFISAIYCDDIRSEVGSKVSLMGVYNSELLVKEFPLALPKFFIQANARMSLDSQAEDLKFQVLLGDDVVSELSLPEGYLQETRAELAKTNTSADSWLGVGVTFQFQGLSVATPGKIKVQAVIDDKIIKGNALRIKEAGAEDTPASGFSLASSE